MTLASPYKTDVTVVRSDLYGGSIMGKERFVSYLRVSTDKQGRAGLGIEAQRELVKRHLGEEGPIQEFVEVESGKRTDRPQLAAALAACRAHGATLIIAKLDRHRQGAQRERSTNASRRPMVSDERKAGDAAVRL